VRPTRSLFTNVPDIVSCIDVIESKSMASMLSLNRGVLLGAYSEVVGGYQEVDFDFQRQIKIAAMMIPIIPAIVRLPPLPIF
jgi:hypothetical protein